MGFRKVFTNPEVSNEILLKDVVNKLTDKNSSVINSVITMNSWNRCTNDEIMRIVKGRAKVAQHSSVSFAGNDDDEDIEFEEEGEQEDCVQQPNRTHVAEMMKQNHLNSNSSFDKWIFEDFVVQSSHTIKSYAAPSSPGIWTISVFSIGSGNSLAIESKDIFVVNRN